jgi:hypothetical protein
VELLERQAVETACTTNFPATCRGDNKRCRATFRGGSPVKLCLVRLSQLDRPSFTPRCHTTAVK